MRRLLTLLLAAAAIVAMVFAPEAASMLAPQLADEPAAAPARPVRAALLACPELAVTEDSANTLAAMVVPSVGAESGEEATASLRRIGADLDLARITAPGDPLALLVAARSQAPIVLRATGGWAGGAIAGVVSADRGGAGAGLASASCPGTAADWWFVGTGSELGRGAALLISNPSAEPARFDLSLFARSGPIEALAGKGIDLGPQSSVRLRLDALAPEEPLLAIKLQVTSGRVAAALRDVAVAEDDRPRGVDFLPPAAAPATSLAIGAAPAGDGARTLVLVNPGTAFATVTPRLVTEEGILEISELPSLAVPAGSVVALPVAEYLDGAAGTLLLTSDVPVTGSLQAERGDEERDVSWVSAVPAVAAPNPLAAAAAVLSGPDLTTTVTVTAPEGPAAGVLEVWQTTTPDQSILDPDVGATEGDEETAGTGDRTGGPVVITGEEVLITRVRVTVPAGTLHHLELPEADEPGLFHVVWRSDASSAPVVVSHATVGADAPLLTGYAWWPTRSAVAAVPVREDVGVLAPPG